MSAKINEFTFQNDMIRQLEANGWLLGKPDNYNRELALYEEDVLGFVKDTQDVSGKIFAGFILTIRRKSSYIGNLAF